MDRGASHATSVKDAVCVFPMQRASRDALRTILEKSIIIFSRGKKSFFLWIKATFSDFSMKTHVNPNFSAKKTTERPGKASLRASRTLARSSRMNYLHQNLMGRSFQKLRYLSKNKKSKKAVFTVKVHYFARA